MSRIHQLPQHVFVVMKHKIKPYLDEGVFYEKDYIIPHGALYVVSWIYPENNNLLWRNLKMFVRDYKSEAKVTV